MSTEQRKDLRIRMRRMRRAVDPRGIARAARELGSRLASCDFFESARRVAAYLPNDGEIDTGPVIQNARSAGKSIFLPVVQPDGRLSFAAFAETSRLKKNRYGIPEPEHTSEDLCTPAELDLVLAPLVAFDDALFRLGMGGGYYDRTFAFKKIAGVIRPRLVGIGYDFQRVDTVFPEKWDVPASHIITDKAIYMRTCAE